MMQTGVNPLRILKPDPDLLLKYVFKRMRNSLLVMYIALSHNYCLYLHKNIYIAMQQECSERSISAD